MRQMDVVVMLHSHLPYVLNHGRWPHGSDWICEAAIDAYLPLLESLRSLQSDNVAAPLTIGVTPILANQLAHATFARELDDYFTQRLAACDDAVSALVTGGEEDQLPLVGFWRARLVRLQRLFHDIAGDLPAAWRRLQDAERIELTTSAATHGFLPLLSRDESIRLQLHLGASEHRRFFGRAAEGCWLPECAYRPGGAWEPLPGEGARERSGLEGHLEDAGFRYTFVDSHMAQAGSPLGVYGELFGGEAGHVVNGVAPQLATRTPYTACRVTRAAVLPGIAALVRDPRSSLQVWSRHGGYPGDGAYLEFHKIRWPGGLRLWRVTDPSVGLGEKASYDPAVAHRTAHDHAVHFAQLMHGIADDQLPHGGTVIVAPFDTELFGHWWFEGPDFLEDFYRELPWHAPLRATTAGAHVDAHAPDDAVRLRAGSWGRNGDYTMWLGERVNWTWPVVWGIEERFWSLAPRALGDARVHEILAQAAREMLLLQSSDWPFIMSTGDVEDYAVRRFTGHAGDCDRLLDALVSALDGGDADPGTTLARALQRRDDVFPDILPSIASALDRERAGSTIRAGRR